MDMDAVAWLVNLTPEQTTAMTMVVVKCPSACLILAQLDLYNVTLMQSLDASCR
jgi:hypothetical protein